MIYLCTKQHHSYIEHTFYNVDDETFYAVEYYPSSGYLCYLKNYYDKFFDDTKMFHYIVPDILNIVIYQDYAERMIIIKNCIDKIIFNNI